MLKRHHLTIRVLWVRRRETCFHDLVHSPAKYLRLKRWSGFLRLPIPSQFLRLVYGGAANVQKRQKSLSEILVRFLARRLPRRSALHSGSRNLSFFFPPLNAIAWFVFYPKRKNAPPTTLDLPEAYTAWHFRGGSTARVLFFANRT